MAGIAYNDRVLVLGQTRSGKSELLNHLFTQMRSQRLLIDTKDEFTVAGVQPVRRMEEIDWTAPVIHYIDASGGPDEFDELFANCLRRRRMTVFVHELADLCAHQPNRTPRWVNAYITKGAAHGLGLVAGSQRPKRIPAAALSEPQHVFQFVPRLTRREDHRDVCDAIGLDADELAGELDQLQRAHGRHAFLWWSMHEQELTAWEPLPDDIRRRIVVSRRTVA